MNQPNSPAEIHEQIFQLQRVDARFDHLTVSQVEFHGN
jgi:hypothetical protein